MQLKKSAFDHKKSNSLCEEAWNTSIVDELKEYIKIPNQSPHYDPEWATNGYQEQAVEMMVRWVKEQKVPDLSVEVVKLEGRTPLIFLECPSTAEKNKDETVLQYGHMDKQPPMTGWDEDLGPWKPVYRDGKLYGRGGADDGYAIYAAVTAIRAIKEQGIPHARIVTIIEGCEESGSFDLPFYVDHLKARIGTPSLIICLDSGCGNYETMWVTTSLRGVLVGNLKVKILNEGVHSGMASGIVPSSFRIARMVLNRIEDVDTGKITVPELSCEVPSDRLQQIEAQAKAVGRGIFCDFPFVEGAGPVDPSDVKKLIINRTWSAALSTVGAAGLPHISNAGNVLRPETILALSVRLPPLVDPDKAGKALKTLLEKDPPYGAEVTFDIGKGGPGWNAPAAAPWLNDALMRASNAMYDKPVLFHGEGGSIPFMGMLGEKFPQAQFFITGVLGPKSNAHGPNEFLHVPFATKLTTCVASVLADHCATFCS